MAESGERFEWVKPIMLSGGVAMILGCRLEVMMTFGAVAAMATTFAATTSSIPTCIVILVVTATCIL